MISGERFKYNTELGANDLKRIAVLIVLFASKFKKLFKEKKGFD